MYLEGRFPEISEDVQALAIVTYALALSNSARANDFNAQLKTLATEGKRNDYSPMRNKLLIELCL